MSDSHLTASHEYISITSCRRCRHRAGNSCIPARLLCASRPAGHQRAAGPRWTRRWIAVCHGGSFHRWPHHLPHPGSQRAVGPRQLSRRSRPRAAASSWPGTPTTSGKCRSARFCPANFVTISMWMDFRLSRRATRQLLKRRPPASPTTKPEPGQCSRLGPHGHAQRATRRG